MIELRTPQNMFESNIVGKYLFNLSNGTYVTIYDVYNMIKDFNLNNNCPEKVKDFFNNARNLFLYSYYNYEFNRNTRQELITSLEFAIKQKAQLENISSCRGLSRLIRLAQDQKWFNDENIKRVDEKVKNWDDWEQMIKFLINIRNEYAHGSNMLWSISIKEFSIIRNLINILFE